MTKSTKIEKAKSKEVAVFDPTSSFNPADNLEGTTPRLPKISIVHAGQIFKVGVEEKKEAALSGVIIDSNRVNAYWSNSFTDSGGGDPPDCSSRDAMRPDGGENAQAETCMACPQNKFGSD